MPHGNVPDIYVDFVQIAAGEPGVFLALHAISPLGDTSLESEGDLPSSRTELKAKIRFSLGNAKAFSMLIRRTLQQYEEEHGQINLPSGFQEETNISEDEWLDD